MRFYALPDDGDVNEYMAVYLALQLEQFYGHILPLTGSHSNLSEVGPLMFEAARNLKAFEELDCNGLPVDYGGSAGRRRRIKSVSM